MSARRASLLVLLCMLPSLAPAAELGRLFLTPAERAELDRLRHVTSVPTMPTAPSTSTSVSEPAVPPPPSIAVTVNGYVARSAGAPTMWINGADASASKLSELGIDGRRVRLDAARVRVPLNSSGGNVALKPGQSFDPISRQVSDAYERQARP